MKLNWRHTKGNKIGDYAMTVMTDIEKPGTMLVPSSQRRQELAMHIGALRAAGHAIVVDEVIEHGHVTGDIRVFHYRTCNRCKKGVL